MIPGMNNITVVLRRPQEMAWEAIDKLQRWWEESDALEPESREISIPGYLRRRGGTRSWRRRAP